MTLNKIIIVIIALGLSLTLLACGKQPTSYPIDSKVYTTLDRTIVPVPVPSTSPKLYPYETSKFASDGYGLWQYGPGLGYEKRLEPMPSGYSTATLNHTANLLHFFTLTDAHIEDEKSPAQMLYFGYKGGNSSAYSPQILYTTQVLDAAVQTINALNKQKQFDFGIALGDAVNNAQYNELRWYIDVVDGKNVNPDSGVKDDPIPGHNNDYQDEFKAAGLDKMIPWYQTIGNHDHLWMGSYPVIDYLRQAYTGSNVLVMGDLATEGINSRTDYTGVIDGRTPDGEMIDGDRSSTLKPLRQYQPIRTDVRFPLRIG